MKESQNNLSILIRVTKKRIRNKNRNSLPQSK